MAEKPGYKVDFLPAVKEALLRLGDRAAAAGLHREYVRAVRAIIDRLRTRPLEWGDPLWRTHKPGGMVYQGNVDPLLVRYVVYEHQRYVCILKIMPVPRSRLD